jgi:hypothetical protein
MKHTSDVTEEYSPACGGRPRGRSRLDVRPRRAREGEALEPALEPERRAAVPSP